MTMRAITSWNQGGDELSYVLQDELGIDCEPAEQLANLLVDRDSGAWRDGDEPFFDFEHGYERRRVSSGGYAYVWRDFSSRIKHERRFFDDEARQCLATILGEPDSPQAAELPVLEIGPGTRVQVLFRARRATSNEEAHRIAKTPAAELGPPPRHLATAGRMNPAGISVFHGACSENIAVAEVRPSVGGLVVTGAFRPVERLRLLNLPKIGADSPGSVFAPEYKECAARLAFLKIFHALIASPVQPYHEPLEYIPTQAVAEYVTSVLGLHGILYASTQVGAAPAPDAYMRELSDEQLAQHNVVLFIRLRPS
jgi:hypothetical protein